MSSIQLEEKRILEYIKESIHDMKICLENVEHARYHHNTSYKDAISICKYGILSMIEQNKLGIRDYSLDTLKIMSDITSHVNGSDAISLSVVGLKDLYPDEEEYDPYSMTQVDFLISSSIKASRSTHHYGNEFLSFSNIKIQKLRAVDIRLLRLIESIENEKITDYPINKVVDKYNRLRKIALAIKQTKLDISIREMSGVCPFSIDIDRLSKTPKIVIK